MIPGRLFNLLTAKKLEPVNIDYDLKLFGGATYRLFLKFHIKEAWYTDILEAMEKTKGKKIPLLDEFIIDKRFYARVSRDIMETVKKIESKCTAKKKYPNFAIITVSVENMTAKKDKHGMVETKIDITGVYDGIE